MIKYIQKGFISNSSWFTEKMEITEKKNQTRLFIEIWSKITLLASLMQFIKTDQTVHEYRFRPELVPIHFAFGVEIFIST